MTSQINPNNVNGNFPIAGVPNSTQGFRDNFTNIKTNFEFAETEIDDLQSKAILKSALAGSTLDNNVGNNLVYNARVQGISGTLVQIANTTGFINIDASAGPYQSIVMGGNINLAFTANTWPAAGAYGKVRVEITGTTGQTITLPSAVTQGTLGIQGINAGVITLAASGTYEFDFSTSDGGSTLTVFDLNRPLNYYTNPLTVAATTISTSAGSGALVVSGGVGINGNLYVSGNIVGSVVATGNTFVGNTTVGNLLTAGFVSAGGNVTGGNVLTGGVVSATGNITGGNLLSATLSLSGNVLSAINLTANVTTTANVAGGNLKSTGIMSATGNVTGGNISSLGLITIAGNVIAGNVNTAGGVSSTGNVNSGNVLTSGVVSATGNVTGGNVNTAGVVSATGNIDGGNVLTANVNATIHTGTTVSVTGNITGGNVLGGANVNATTHTGATVSVTGNVTGGNISTAGLITATGNITGGNVLGGANVNATTHTGATVSVTGNVTGGNVLSDAVISAVGAARILSGTAVPAGGTTGAGYNMSSTTNLGIFFGSGAPTLSAAQGSLYLRTDGTTTNDRMYINTNGSTTWTAVTTVA